MKSAFAGLALSLLFFLAALVIEGLDGSLDEACCDHGADLPQEITDKMPSKR